MATVEFSDPRLVAIFDSVNRYDDAAQPGFVRSVAAAEETRTIVDLGCGTGVITCELARLGYPMVGVDPAPAMIEIARRRPGGDQVRWVVGGADRLGTPDADLAIMTGHVAQFFLADDAWRDALAALHGALRPGGRLTFESRDPDARDWERWASERRATVEDPVAGLIETWTEVHEMRDDIVSYSLHYAFASTGEEIVAPSRLRYRSEAELRTTLADAGFTTEQIYGGWDRRPVGDGAPELIVVASR